MELLRLASGRGLRIGDTLHVAANLGFIGMLALIIFVWQLPLLALVLAILSKWRILAVRPRFWSINFRSNLLDFLFIVSVTSLIINPLASLAAQIGWLLLLAAWLLVLKPLSTRSMMFVQAGAAQFVSITALLTYSSFITMNQVFMLAVVAGAWVIGYASARHVISSYDTEPKTEFLALLWGFIVAQLTWLFSHWLHIYTLVPGFEIPQIALILLLLSFCSQRVYALQRHIRDHDDPHMQRKATRQELRSTYGAAVFSTSFIIIILLTTNWTITI